MSKAASSATPPSVTGQESASLAQAQIPEPSRVSTVEDLVKFWNDPDRPRLTPEEAADFEADIKAARAEMDALPLRRWE